MTEEDLKKTWCPHARMPLAASTSVRGAAGTPATFIVGNLHGDGSVPKEALCRGSACSQFRRVTTYQYDIGKEKPPGEGWVAATNAYWPWVRETDTGQVYCGLAGKP